MQKLRHPEAAGLHKRDFVTIFKILEFEMTIWKCQLYLHLLVDLKKRKPTASLKTSFRTLVPTAGETLVANLTSAAKNFLVLSTTVSGLEDGPLNNLRRSLLVTFAAFPRSHPKPVTLLKEGVEGRTLCVGGTETDKEGEEVE